MVFDNKPAKFSPKFEVVSCYIEYQEKILLVLRHPNKPQGSTWCVSGGKVEIDESLTDAVLREVKEETTINIEMFPYKYAQKYFVRHHGYDFVYHTFHAFVTRPVTVVLDSIDNTDYRWVGLREALRMDLIPDEDTCIKKYFRK